MLFEGIAKIFKKIENSKKSFSFFTLILLFFILFRNLIEGFLEHNHKIVSSYDFFFTFNVWYFSTVLLLAIVLSFLLKKEIVKTTKIVISFWWIIIIIPIFDFIMTNGAGAYPVFILFNPENLITAFFSLVTVPKMLLSPGQYFGMAILFILFILYIYSSTRNILSTIKNTIILYISFFLIAAFPSLIIAILGLDVEFIYKTNRLLYDEILKILNPFLLSVLLLGLLSVWVYLYNKELAGFIKKNLRLKRGFHYVALTFFGYAIAVNSFNVEISLVHIVSLMFSVFMVFEFSNIWNILNESKAPAKFIDNLKDISYVALFLAVMYLFIPGYLPATFVLVSSVIGVMYSYNPFRLKRFPILNNLSLALISPLVMLSGFALAVNPIQFPFVLIGGIYFVLFAGFNLKDLKDIEFDRKQSNITLPVLIGYKKSLVLFSIISLISFILLGLVLFLPATIAGYESILFIFTILIGLVWSGFIFFGKFNKKMDLLVIHLLVVDTILFMSIILS